ncbi:AAA family ATPase [Actinospica robiniae]|uniref:AAA family ATPase n=1 Tax=Actinospica robiniae TaxID=304901 RepID=UPI0003FD181A|nr:AAA family ATPase [Actinospica robiniae]
MYLIRVDVPDARDPRRTRHSRLEFTRPDGDFAGWTVVVGRSQTGKSRLLAEISLAADGVAGEDPYAVAWSGEAAPICLYYVERRPAAASVAATTDSDEVDIELIAGLDPVEDIHIATFALEISQALRHRGADRDAAAVVLIDDVEAHLHPVWQRRIGPWLTSRFPRTQFIATTNSPYVCQAADPGGLIRLLGPREHYAAEVVGPELYQRVVYGSADDAALSELFNLDSAYSERAQRIRAELVELEREIVRGRASAAEEVRHRELSRLLTSSTSARADEIAVRRRERRREER